MTNTNASVSLPRLFSAVRRSRRECQEWTSAVERAIQAGDVTTACVLRISLDGALARFQTLRTTCQGLERTGTTWR